MASIVDNYSETNHSANSYLTNSIDGNIQVGQTFTGKKGKLTSCKFYLSKFGSPTGDITAKIYAHTGTYGTSGKPTGSVLATSSTVDVSGLPSTPNNTLTEFTFSGDQSIDLDSIPYCVLLEYSEGDGENALFVGTDTSSPTHSGNLFTSSDGTNWTAESGQDCCFYVYGLVSNFLIMF